MLDLNSTILATVMEQALADAADHPRWTNAIRRAFEEVDSNPYMTRDSTGHGLIIGSPSGQCYAANGTCTCTSYTGIDLETGQRLHAGGKPCWHRAAARLVRRHDDAQRVAAGELADRVIVIVEATQATLTRKHAAAQQATLLINELFA
jgi:hypothetical protein